MKKGQCDGRTSTKLYQNRSTSLEHLEIRKKKLVEIELNSGCDLQSGAKAFEGPGKCLENRFYLTSLQGLSQKPRV